jgi:hypothetical protein
MSQLNPYYNPVRYSIEKRPFFKFSFSNVETVQINYSQLHQDMFVLCALNGMRNGTYLEIGANEPILNSNTYLLENFFGWQGISLELSTAHVERFNMLRRNICLLQDATIADFDDILIKAKLPSVIDYLSVDCEPSSNTFKSLLRLPHNKTRFRVITFEHDYGAAHLNNNQEEMLIRQKSRDFLQGLGYHLVVSNISWLGQPIEDWWVDPQLVSEENFRNLIALDKPLNDHIEFMYKTVPQKRLYV